MPVSGVGAAAISGCARAWPLFGKQFLVVGQKVASGPDSGGKRSDSSKLKSW